MGYFLKVQNLSNGSSWETTLHQSEFPQIQSHIRDGIFKRRPVVLLTSWLLPIRTNNGKNFAKDFFLPTLINQALRVEDSAARIFAILGAILIDVVTFPIRVLTAIPRIVYNGLQKPHPLATYLRDNGVDEQILETGHVYVEYGLEGPTSLSGFQHVNLIAVPLYKGSSGVTYWGSSLPSEFEAV